MIKDFVAIDFETANHHLSSVCSVGVVLVRDGEVVDTYYSLIHPEPGYYCFLNRRIHGLSSRDTRNSPLFPAVWAEVERLIAATYEHPEAVPLVAHNSRFDEGCLRSVFHVYQLDYPDYQFLDTLAAARRHFKHTLPNCKLHTVAAACGFDLRNHHHALADAEACAAIALAIM